MEGGPVSVGWRLKYQAAPPLCGQESVFPFSCCPISMPLG